MTHALHRMPLYRGDVFDLQSGRKNAHLIPLPEVPRFSLEYEERWNAHAIPPGGAMPDVWSWWEGPAHGPSLYHSEKIPFRLGDLVIVQEQWKRSILAQTLDKVRTVQQASIAFPDGREIVHHHPAADWAEADTRWQMPETLPDDFSRYTLQVTGVLVSKISQLTQDQVLELGLAGEGKPEELLEDYWGVRYRLAGKDERVRYDRDPWVTWVRFRRMDRNFAVVAKELGI